MRALIRETCRSKNVEILRGAVKADHVHLFVSVPPSVAPSRLMQAVKGKTSHHLLLEYRRLKREFRMSSSGGLTSGAAGYAGTR